MAFGGTNVPTGEKNVIEHISVNGVKIDPINKKVDIPVPENTDTNTTYTLAKSGNTLTLTGSDGSKSTVTVSEENTTYSLAKQGNQIVLTGSNGSKSSVEAVNTTYSLEKSGSTITLKGSDGSTSSVTEKTYGEASEAQSGIMSKEDKAKLNGIPSGGMNAYAGTILIDAVASNSPFKIATASKPKFMQMYETATDNTNFRGSQIRCYTQNGDYYLSGSQSAHIAFENDGIKISWAANSGIGSTTHQYFILC